LNPQEDCSGDCENLIADRSPTAVGGATRGIQSSPLCWRALEKNPYHDPHRDGVDEGEMSTERNRATREFKRAINDTNRKAFVYIGIRVDLARACGVLAATKAEG
jgi:hypothetical protein